MTNKEAICKACELGVREIEIQSRPITNDNGSSQERQDLLDVVKNILLRVRGVVLCTPQSPRDIRDIETACLFSTGVRFEELENDFLCGDKLPMTETEFVQWHTMLWNAMWNDKDERFKGKTVGEMWDILIKEEHFPKKRFYNELDRRGLLPAHIKKENEDAHKMKLTKLGIEAFRQFVKDHNWVSFEVPGFDGLFLRSNTSMSTGSVTYGTVLEFYKTAGDWYVSSDNGGPHQRSLSGRDAILTFDYHPSRKDEFVRWINSYGWRVTRDIAFATDPIEIGNLHNSDSKITVHMNDTVGVFLSASKENEMVVLASCGGTHV